MNEAQESVLCDCCRCLFLQPDILQVLASAKGLDDRRKRSNMINSAVAGCMLCRELLCMPFGYKATEPSAADGTYVRTHESSESSDNVYASVKSPYEWPCSLWEATIKKHGSRKPSPWSVKMAWSPDDPTFRFNWKSVPGRNYFKVTRHQMLYPSKELLMEVSTNASDSAVAHIRSQMHKFHGNKDMRSERTYEYVREWLHECDVNHPTCHNELNIPEASNFSPTRVLDVSGRSEAGHEIIKLLPIAGDKILYAALSYCWGTTQSNRTLESNFSAYMQGIELSSLPQTLQDAVFVTRKLGLQYLWVDSMCIIQDSDEDKAREIGRLEYMYSNAYVTISANSSESCTAGFLSPRHHKSEDDIHIMLATESGSTANISLKSIPEPGYRVPFKLEPIYARAWTFQEAFLSRRSLLYSEQQLFWTCSQTWGMDGGRVQHNTYFSEASTYRSYGSAELSHHTLKDPSVWDWKNIIELYSTRNLGDPLDKLPALSSVASFFARKLNDSYVAGLWLSRLCELLCWYGLPEHPLRRSASWRSPSWSFLSVDGHISFQERYRPTSYEPEWDHAESLECKVISCVATPISPEASFGRISSASLVIKGRLIKVNTHVKDGQLWVYPTDQSASTESIGRLTFDTPGIEANGSAEFPQSVHTNHGSWSKSQSLWFFLLCAGSTWISTLNEGSGRKAGYYRWFPWGIALAELPDGRYHRIGYIQGANKNGFASISNKKLQTITIV